MADNPWIVLGIITQPHGVRGQLKLKSLTDPADGFAAYSDLQLADGTPLKLRIDGRAQNQFIVSIEGISDRNDAERWRGKTIGVMQAALPEIDSDTQFYQRDLIGMQVVDAAGNACGIVKQVANYGASDLIEIEQENNSEFYAFTHQNFPRIDKKARIIEFHKPEILVAKKVK